MIIYSTNTNNYFPSPPRYEQIKRTLAQIGSWLLEIPEVLEIQRRDDSSVCRRVSWSLVGIVRCLRAREVWTNLMLSASELSCGPRRSHWDEHGTILYGTFYFYCAVIDLFLNHCCCSLLEFEITCILFSIRLYSERN